MSDRLPTTPRCPHCEKVLPAPNLERCLWCRAALAEYAGPAPLGSVPFVAAPPPVRGRTPAPLAVHGVVYYLHFLAVASWVVTALAACVWRGPRLDILIGGIFLGICVGAFLRHIARDLARGEPSARLRATVVLALHLLRWPLTLVGIAGLAALHAGAGARWLSRRRGQLLTAEDDRVRPYWRSNGIDGT